MPPVNQVIRERKLVWRGLKRQLKAVDTVLERMERRQNRVLGRKRKAPELQDLQNIIGDARVLQTEIDRYAKILAAGYAA